MNEASPNNPWKLSNRGWRLIPFVMTPLNLNTTFYILLLHRTKGFFLNNNDLQNLQEAGNLYLVETSRLVLPNHLAAAMNWWSCSLYCYHFNDVCAIEVRFFRSGRLKANTECPRHTLSLVRGRLIADFYHIHFKNHWWSFQSDWLS